MPFIYGQLLAPENLRSRNVIAIMSRPMMPFI